MTNTMRLMFFWSLLVGICLVRANETLPERVIVIDACEYATTAAAQAAWKPIASRTLPVQRDVVDGRSRLALPLNFEAHDSWRVGWDLWGKWDLSACQTIRLDVSVEGDSPASMMLYLRSGSGWYTIGFAGIPGEHSVELPRRKFKFEDTPGGWDRIDCIRIAVMREEGPARQVFLSGLEGVSRTVHVALYRNDLGIQIESSVPEYIDRMAAALDRLSIGYEVLSDTEVENGRLDGRKVAILPLNPQLSPQGQKRLEEFVANGGRLIVCYAAPAPLDSLLGVRVTWGLTGEGDLHAFTFEPSDAQAPFKTIQKSWVALRVQPDTNTKVRAVWENHEGVLSSDPAVTSNSHGFYVGHVLTGVDQESQDQLLQTMIGELWPGMWMEVWKMREASLGKVAGFTSEAELREAIARQRAQSGNKAEIDRWLQTADTCLAEANEPRLIQTNPVRMIDALARAQEGLLKAYAASVPPRADEFRAVWCHSPTGVSGMTWDEAIKRLADSGFNAIIPNMSWGYSAAYTSSVLPMASGVVRDELAECLVAAKKYGVDVHVWRVNWNLFWKNDSKQIAELRAAGRLQVGPTGELIEGLCPSNPENQKLELDAMLELARNSDVAGVHFDYIRYSGWDACFCEGCRERFEKHIHSSIKNWPVDVITGAHWPAYAQFRRDLITQLVAAVSEYARHVRPGIKISAAVFPDWATARDSVGQDWKHWVEKGYLDFVCPMQYTESAPLFEADTKRSAKWVGGKVPFMPGIGATLGLTPDGTLEQVLAARRHAPGFVLFNYDRGLLKHLDLLKLGATRGNASGQ